MDPIEDNWHRLEELFNEAVELPPEAVVDFCNNACGEDKAYLRNTCEMAYFKCVNDHQQALLEILFSLRFKTEFNEWKTH